MSFSQSVSQSVRFHTLRIRVGGMRAAARVSRTAPCPAKNRRAAALPFLGGAKGQAQRLCLHEVAWNENMKAAGRAQKCRPYLQMLAHHRSWLRVAEQNMAPLACTCTIMGSAQGHTAPWHRLHARQLRQHSTTPWHPPKSTQRTV
jgi:hypothetical protein